jgi:hypothetical protein
MSLTLIVTRPGEADAAPTPVKGGIDLSTKGTTDPSVEVGHRRVRCPCGGAGCVRKRGFPPWTLAALFSDRKHILPDEQGPGYKENLKKTAIFHELHGIR